MDDILAQLADALVTAIVGALIYAFQRWKANRDFENTRGQNQALRDLMKKTGVESDAPTQTRRRGRRASLLLPKAPTPLPFWPVEAARKNEGDGP